MINQTTDTRPTLDIEVESIGDENTAMKEYTNLDMRSEVALVEPNLEHAAKQRRKTRLSGWLPGWQAGWLAVKLASWLAGWMAGWVLTMIIALMSQPLLINVTCLPCVSSLSDQLQEWEVGHATSTEAQHGCLVKSAPTSCSRSPSAPATALPCRL